MCRHIVCTDNEIYKHFNDDETIKTPGAVNEQILFLLLLKY